VSDQLHIVPSRKWVSCPLSATPPVGHTQSMLEAIDKWENEGGALPDDALSAAQADGWFGEAS
jgi:hypothetical protein